ncbi:MAG: DUF4065 domain-containing protein [Prevotellaceae bacterium]|nr:DUF4065 domain-containing protein [Prevotellaceae bacterium]
MTKIQKLTYIAYGIFLAVKERPIINERPQAWPYGPVFPTTRNKLLNLDLNSICLSDNDLKDISSDKDIVDLVELIYNNFNWSAAKLSKWSHKEGSPWEATVSKQGFKWGDRIEDDRIKSYFKKLIVIKNDE